MKTPAALTCLFAAAAAAGAAGCGGGSPASGADAVKSAWRATAVAMADGRGDDACKGFTPAVARTLATSSGFPCHEAVRQLSVKLTKADRASVASAPISNVALSGGRATITFQLTPGLRKLGFRGQSRLFRTGDTWLIGPRTG